MKPSRHSEIRVVGADGVVHTGTGDGLALAVRQLGAEHLEQIVADINRREQAADTGWTLTPAGWAAAWRGAGR